MQTLNNLPHFRRKINISGEEFIIARARKRDIPEIQNLYNEVYEGKYTIPEIIQKKKMEKIIYDKNRLWVVAINKDKKICASYIFAIDFEKLIGKLYAAVVHPNFRGRDIMPRMINATKRFLEKNNVYLDTVYATFRTVSLAPKKVLSDLGFISLGIFPNVHRLDEEETHGLQAWFSENCFETRKKPPFLIPEFLPIYDVIREQLSLEEAFICEHKTDKPIKFNNIIHGERVKRSYKTQKAKNELLFSFFPFHEPNYCFESKKEKIRVYLYSEIKDGHTCILGIYNKDKNIELKQILKAVIEAGYSMRMDYIELLVSAYNIKEQRAAIDSGFLPCAYYPAFDLINNERIDYFICAYSSRDLKFSNVKLFETDRKFIDAYLQNTKYKNILPRIYNIKNNSTKKRKKNG